MTSNGVTFGLLSTLRKVKVERAFPVVRPRLVRRKGVKFVVVV
jgi:hypothetical protein